ncbi:undecaprenyldiphospho-muramoylpentapeptide beta-N-acetylglucosaminyltransferase [Pseudonocardia alni]|uniref:UDP-N-acetylglucosamine--N-acetylmuramyl-(pentapeptide) pyrophosphoryl-undecaprenol N-acetylglucosamine transferase n=1 Tax=Pseudonocardia alni TaxID=33907 RepID=A0AA44UTX0_PSEA5|nr:undecaprenyldiphospho-muramoylpentapeptide beta-N-acetylglucosaminyltransferase [Pseudonocardia alni]
MTGTDQTGGNDGTGSGREPGRRPTMGGRAPGPHEVRPDGVVFGGPDGAGGTGGRPGWPTESPSGADLFDASAAPESPSAQVPASQPSVEPGPRGPQRLPGTGWDPHAQSRRPGAPRSGDGPQGTNGVAHGDRSAARPANGAPHEGLGSDGADRHDGPHTDGPRNGVARNGADHHDAPRTGDLRNGTPQSAAPQNGAPRSGGSRNGAPRNGVPRGAAEGGDQGAPQGPNGVSHGPDGVAPDGGPRGLDGAPRPADDAGQQPGGLPRRRPGGPVPPGAMPSRPGAADDLFTPRGSTGRRGPDPTRSGAPADGVPRTGPGEDGPAAGPAPAGPGPHVPGAPATDTGPTVTTPHTTGPHAAAPHGAGVNGAGVNGAGLNGAAPSGAGTDGTRAPGGRSDAATGPDTVDTTGPDAGTGPQQPVADGRGTAGAEDPTATDPGGSTPQRTGPQEPRQTGPATPGPDSTGSTPARREQSAGEPPTVAHPAGDAAALPAAASADAPSGTGWQQARTPSAPQQRPAQPGEREHAGVTATGPQSGPEPGALSATGPRGPVPPHGRSAPGPYAPGRPGAGPHGPVPGGPGPQQFGRPGPAGPNALTGTGPYRPAAPGRQSLGQQGPGQQGPGQQGPGTARPGPQGPGPQAPGPQGTARQGPGYAGPGRPGTAGTGPFRPVGPGGFGPAAPGTPAPYGPGGPGAPGWQGPGGPVAPGPQSPVAPQGPGGPRPHGLQGPGPHGPGPQPNGPQQNPQGDGVPGPGVPGPTGPDATRTFGPATTRPAGEQAPAPVRGGLSVVVAGGGSAGHIEPALAVADAIRRLVPGARVTALGTEKGLDTQLIPARGYPLELIPPVPLPRKPTADLFKLPGNVRGAVKRVREVLEAAEADVVVGFGGFVSLPAYLGARGRVPIVVHEANARAGLANKVGARFASAVCVAVPGTGLANEEVVGMPLRRSITTLDRASLRPEARTYFNLPPHGPVLLVFGGSQGSRTLNDAVAGALPAFTERGISVLHAYGKNGTPADPRPGYVPVPYIERMDLAYAAADVVLGRSGMTTVAELTAVGLPAVYVPLPHGNGEQALNARPVVEAGGGKLVQDEDMNGERAIDELMPMLTDPDLALAMGRRARAAGHGEADEKIARIVMEVAGR